tara:strand:- start:5105 stop:6898 length:1794 start_codon:yes stop_codon:yes gene_type:complete
MEAPWQKAGSGRPVDHGSIPNYGERMKIILLFLILLMGLSSFSAGVDLTTIAERSMWSKTGRADETERLCKGFAKKYSKRVQCQSYGITPEGRTMWYLQIHDDSSSAHAPVVWIQAGIHAGEIDGKDAVFLLMKNVLEKKLTPDPFKGLKVIFIPIVNLDGHERFGKWNRPNQIGPEEMGWRVTAQNYNMNRDFVKSEASEMRDLNKLWNKQDPIISLDLHVTDGAHFQPEVGIITTPTDYHGSGPLHKAGKDYENQLMEKMKARGRLALPFYPSFENEDKPTSGFSRGVSPPRFANGYWFVRNRIGVLVESHSWKDYATRVKVHYDTVLSTLEIAQQKGAEWTKQARELDKVSIAGKKIDVSFKHTPKSSMIDFGGYKYTISKSKISGADVIRYETDKPETWKVPFYEEIQPSVTVTAAEQGYFIPASEMDSIKSKFDVHGVTYLKWKKPLPEKVKVFRASKAQQAASSFEGRQTLTVEGEWKEEKIELPKNMFFVPIDQRNAMMVVHLLEPLAPDSLLYWGFFNRFFEIKEYMEDYVAEDVAKQMLESSKQVAAEFQEKLKDEAFAKDPNKRFRFFYQKHTSWDDHYNRYPIFKQ